MHLEIQHNTQMSYVHSTIYEIMHVLNVTDQCVSEEYFNIIKTIFIERTFKVIKFIFVKRIHI